jgi:hypothetical protein
MTPFGELVSGTVGPTTVDMLTAVAGQTVRARNYPAPSGNDAWDTDEILELVADMVAACSDGKSFIDEMLADATDDESLARIVAHRIGIAFAERSRDSNDGQLARRVSRLLRENSTLFHRVPDTQSWTHDLATVDLEADTDEDNLLRAAHAVPNVRWTRYNLDSEKRSPYAPKDDLERLATAILERAGAPVPERTIIKTFAGYFGLRPTNFSIDEEDTFDVSSGTDPSDDAAVKTMADFIWAQLDDQERAIIPFLEESLDKLRDNFSITRHRADSLRISTRTVIARALGMDSNTAPEDIPSNAPEVFIELERRAMNHDFNRSDS